MTQGEFAALEAYMLSHAGEAVHAADHIYRVLGNALTLAESEPGTDREILIAACLLHDVGRAQELKTGADHALVGGDMAYDFLLSRGWPAHRAAWVRDCIRSHRFRGELPPETIEARILFDSDKLDAVGPIGVARTLQYGALLNDEPLYRLDREGRILTGAEGEPSFFQEYDRKLRSLSGQMLTRKGRELAGDLQEAANRFYDALLLQLRRSVEQGQDKLKALGLRPRDGQPSGGD